MVLRRIADGLPLVEVLPIEERLRVGPFRGCRAFQVRRSKARQGCGLIAALLDARQFFIGGIEVPGHGGPVPRGRRNSEPYVRTGYVKVFHLVYVTSRRL